MTAKAHKSTAAHKSVRSGLTKRLNSSRSASKTSHVTIFLLHDDVWLAERAPIFFQSLRPVRTNFALFNFINRVVVVGGDFHRDDDVVYFVSVGKSQDGLLSSRDGNALRI